ncbi:MAG: hypothetical protein K5899_11055 [Bacteroidaceae bacterium]|nr:hypothetical protein [Bacteroidaceae bacterium]
MKINVKIKKVVAQREWSDKQTGENRKVVEVIAEEITNEAYKDQYLVCLFDSKADVFNDNFKEGDAVVMNVGFTVGERWYTNKEGQQCVEFRQRVAAYSCTKL